MPKVTYHVVQHDWGWAYKVGDVFSETFASHELARAAAERAAAEQEVGGEPTDIEYEDPEGRWRVEEAKGGDRPETEVEEGEPPRPEQTGGGGSASRGPRGDETVPLRD